MLSIPLLFPTVEIKRTGKGAGVNCFYPANSSKQQQTTSEEQMKFNKWTLGLAGVGAVSLASAVRADEAKIIPLQTTLANTTISGYVDTAVQYNAGNVGPIGDSYTP